MNTTVPRIPMERKPKSLMIAPGTIRAIAAAAQRVTTMVTLVVYSFFFTSASPFESLQKMSFTRMDATPRERPAPPAMTVIRRVPRTIPATNFGM